MTKLPCIGYIVREAGEFRFVFFVRIIYADYTYIFKTIFVWSSSELTSNLEETHFVTTLLQHLLHGRQNICCILHLNIYNFILKLNNRQRFLLYTCVITIISFKLAFYGRGDIVEVRF